MASQQPWWAEKACARAAGDFAGDPAIPAEEIRQFLLPDGAGASCVESIARLEFRNARISGSLDLRGAACHSGALRRLTFRDCVFDAEIDLSYAKVFGLSFDGSRFSSLLLEQAHIEGDLCLSRVRAPEGSRYCHVDARGAHIDGGINCVGARLRALKPRRRRVRRDPRQRTALDLRGARVRNSANFEDFEAIGGIDISDARFDSDFWLVGAYLLGLEGSAFRGQTVRIDGSLVMRPGEGPDGRELRFEWLSSSSGAAPQHTMAALWLLSAQVSGWLQIVDATVCRRKARQKSMAGRELGGVALTTAKIEGDLHLTGQIEGGIDMQGARVNGAAFLRLQTLLSSSHRPAMTATNLTVERDLVFAADVDGRVEFDRAAVRGDFDLAIAFFSRPMAEATIGAPPPALSLRGMSAIQSLRIWAVNLALPFIRLRAAVDDFGHPVAGFSCPLSFAPGWEILELVLRGCQPSDATGLRSLMILRRTEPDGVVVHHPIAELVEFRRFVQEDLDLGTAEKAMDYLRAFCAMTNASEGNFRLISRLRDLPLSQRGVFFSARHRKAGRIVDRTIVETPPQGRQFKSLLVYGDGVYWARFHVASDGDVNMLADAPVTGIDAAYQIPTLPLDPKYSRRDGRIRLLPAAAEGRLDAPHLRPFPAAWRPAGREEMLAACQASLATALAADKEAPALPIHELQIDLRDTKVAILDDRHGFTWNDDRFAFQLEGFRYGHVIDSQPAKLDMDGPPRYRRPPEAERARDLPMWRLWGDERGFAPKARMRLRWLALQFPGREPRPIDSLQPYAYMARVLESQGALAFARRISSQFQTFEAKVSAKYELSGEESGPWSRLLRSIPQFSLWVCSDYGWSVARALTTFIAYILLGAGVVSLTNAAGWMVVDTAPVSSVVLDRSRSTAELGVPLSASGASDEELSCKGKINSLVYALDLAVPLVDMREEGRCTVLAPSPQVGPFENAARWLLQVGRGLYLALGWVVTSILVLTASAAAKRRWGGAG